MYTDPTGHYKEGDAKYAPEVQTQLYYLGVQYSSASPKEQKEIAAEAAAIRTSADASQNFINRCSSPTEINAALTLTNAAKADVAAKTLATKKSDKPNEVATTLGAGNNTGTSIKLLPNGKIAGSDFNYYASSGIPTWDKFVWTAQSGGGAAGPSIGYGTAAILGGVNEANDDFIAGFGPDGGVELEAAEDGFGILVKGVKTLLGLDKEESIIAKETLNFLEKAEKDIIENAPKLNGERQITVIGSIDDTKQLAGSTKLNILNDTSYKGELNNAYWCNDSALRGDIIYLNTKEIRPGSIYSKEIDFYKGCGYTQQGNYLIPPK
jgi:hypothetical protein